MCKADHHQLNEAALDIRKLVEPAYLDDGRWASYREMVREVTRINPTSVLEIGPGNRVTSNILQALGFEVYTLDINRLVKPDVVGSVTALPIRRDSFDMIVAQQVLEHLPWDTFAPIIWSMHKIANTAIISVPDVSFHIAAGIKLPLLKWHAGCVTVPISFGPVSKGHCWELGTAVTVRELRRCIAENGFTIERDFRTPEHPYHHFFILRRLH
jgi:hypothetical protein